MQQGWPASALGTLGSRLPTGGRTAARSLPSRRPRRPVPGLGGHTTAQGETCRSAASTQPSHSTFRNTPSRFTALFYLKGLFPTLAQRAHVEGRARIAARLSHTHFLRLAFLPSVFGLAGRNGSDQAGQVTCATRKSSPHHRKGATLSPYREVTSASATPRPPQMLGPETGPESITFFLLLLRADISAATSKALARALPQSGP